MAKPQLQVLAYVLLIGAICSFLFSFSYSQNSNVVLFKRSSSSPADLKSPPLRRSLPPISTRQQSILAVDAKLRSLAASYIDHDFIHPKAHPKRGQKAFGAKMINVRQMAQVTDVRLDIHRPCGGDGGRNQSLVILMYNKAGDVDRRYAIRRTYGAAVRRNPDVDLYFLVANDGDELMQAQLDFESRLYNDIIQVNFAETYYNLTLKTISAIRWTALNCPQVKFMLKLDSDCFLRLNPVLSQVAGLQADRIIGRYRKNTPVNRNKNSKWYIDPLYFPYKRYHQYTPGTFLIPGPMLEKIYGAIVSGSTRDTIPALPYEDVYMGLLADKAKLPMGEFGGIHHMLNLTEAETIQKSTEKSILWGEFDVKQLENLWKRFGVD